MTAQELKRRIPRKAAAAAGFTAILLAAGIVSAINANTFELEGNAVDNIGTGEDWGTLFPTDLSSNELSKSLVADGPAIDETYFTGGSTKDHIDIDTSGATGGWLFDKTSSAQPKADILDSFAAAYSDGAFTPAHKVVYFGADRFSNDGATFMGFWFLKEGLTFGPTANNGVGEINGNHTVGDILVLTDFTQGGPVVNFSIFKWVAAGGDASEHLLKIFQGTDCRISLTVDACSTVNSGVEDAVWPFVPKSNVGPAQKYQAGLFIEGGIDLTAIFPTSDGCFSAFVAETRASFSVTSTLSDFAYGEFNTCGEIDALKYHDKNADGVRDANGADNILGGAGSADDEGPLSGWTIFIDKDADQSLDTGEASGVTDADGKVVFPDLTSGTYSVCEQISDQSGWTNSDPAGSTRCESVNVGTNGAVVSVDFGNYQDVTVKAIKYHDKNADGSRDANGVDNVLGGAGAADDEILLSGWEFFVDTNSNETWDSGVDSAKVSTNASGEASFTLTPGASYSICEVLQSNWVNSEPSGTTICRSTGTIVSGVSVSDLIYGNYPQYRIIILTCSEATGLLVASTVDLDGSGSTFAAKDTIASPPALSGKTAAELQAYLCNLGGAEYDDLAPQTLSSIKAIIPKAS